MSTTETGAGVSTADDRRFFGHPRGLATLFFTEMWERFSYYGMRAFLMLFMVAPAAAGGLGFAKERAGIIYGTYTAMVYLLSLPGGWIADRFLGQQKAVLIGGSLIMAGHIALAVPAGPTFYLGLALVVLGTGLLKPNISAIVGQLYGPEDKRRDAGFSIFYMGINLGALIAPLVCGGYLAESESFRNTLKGMGLEASSAWHFAFGAAAVGMGFGLVQYWRGLKYLGEAGRRPVPPKDAVEAARNRGVLGAVLALSLGVPAAIGIAAVTGAISLTPEKVGSAFDLLLPLTAVGLFVGLFALGKWDRSEKARLVVIMVLFVAAAVFWACFEQAGSTLTLFAKERTHREVLGVSFGATIFQSMNSFFVICLAPIFAWLWVKLATSGKEPTTPTKFGFGMVLVGLGFFVMYPAGRIVESKVAYYFVGPGFLTTLYFVHTAAEMCLSPVGLSSMTKLAPKRIAGMVMGIWFLAASCGNYMAGRAVSLTESMPADQFFLLMTAVPVAIGVILFALNKPIQRMLAASGASGPSTPGH